MHINTVVHLLTHTHSLSIKDEAFYPQLPAAEPGVWPTMAEDQMTEQVVGLVTTERELRQDKTINVYFFKYQNMMTVFTQP